MAQDIDTTHGSVIQMKTKMHFEGKVDGDYAALSLHWVQIHS